MKTIKGWTAITDTISGPELIWKVEDTGQYMPDIYNTEKDVQKSIAYDLIQQLEQFIDDEREYDEVDWELQDHPVEIEIDPNGNIVVWDSTGMPILETTLENWKASI